MLFRSTFGVLSEDGYTETRVLDRAKIDACPHLIMVAEHYREDGSCKCNDPGHKVMLDWGYLWEGGSAGGCWK